MARTSNALLAALLIAAVVAGCGNGKEEVVIDDPVAEALAFVPADAAALAVVATDPSRGPGAALAGLVRRAPGAELLVEQARARLAERLGLESVAALAGEPIVLWAPDAALAQRFAAWVVADAEVLEELLEAPSFEKAGAAGAFSVHVGRGGAVARRGPLLVAAPDERQLRAVLARRVAGRGQWTPRLVEERSLGLPAGAVARVLLDARTLVAARGGAARRVPWVAAIERGALTLAAEPGGVRLHARVSTDAGALAPNDVPVAAGPAPPATRGRAPVVAAVRDPQQTLRVLRRAADLVDPERLAGLREAERLLGRYAGVDVEEDLFARLTGTATLTSPDGRRLTLRAELDDPARTADALERLGTLAKFGGPLATLAGVELNGLDVDEADGRYALTRRGELLVALQVVDGALVASNDPAADLVAAGRAPGPARPLPSAGAFRATLSAQLLREQLLARLGLPELLRGALAPLGAPVITARGDRASFDVQVGVPVG